MEEKLGANSAARRLAKKLLYPLANETSYAYFQAASKAWDIHKGTWTEPELDLLPMGLKPGETAIDLGANFGIYAYFMGKAVGPNGRVFAFEPIPFTFRSLEIVGKLLRFERSVELIEKGCGNEQTTIEFSVPVQGSGALAAGQAYIGSRDDDRDGKEQQVRWDGTRSINAEIIRLDDYLENVQDLSLIKADIEGAELFAFKGAEKLISKFLPTVICEINPWFLDGFGVRLEELTGFFYDLGYKLYSYRVDSGLRCLVRVNDLDVVEDNYVFLHPNFESRFSDLLNA